MSRHDLEGARAPLEGIRVLEIGQLIAGPFAGHLLADYGAEVDILSGVSIAVGEGEIVCVVGPNGAGKSTLMKAVFGLVVPKAGRITLSGRDITGLRPSEIARLGMAYVPQRDNVFECVVLGQVFNRVTAVVEVSALAVDL